LGVFRGRGFGSLEKRARGAQGADAQRHFSHRCWDGDSRDRGSSVEFIEPLRGNDEIAEDAVDSYKELESMT
jgi:hypothetical protein